MSALATALKNSHYSQANDIHIILMLDYPSEVFTQIKLKKNISTLVYNIPFIYFYKR